jgi:phytoene dehydrogenase-like protein
MSSPTNGPWLDALVIGAGFGGLAAALSLAERGARVALHEALAYPGGCASTFRRAGYRFESGATLFSGLSDTQLFGRWITRHGLDVTIDWLDPVIELRTPSQTMTIGRDRAAWIESISSLPGAPREALAAFFALQGRVADALWALLDDPSLLPPLGASALLRHVARLPRHAALLPLLGRPLAAVLERYGLERFTPLRTLLDGLCQITVQCSSAEAEAPFALATMDYCFRGTGHVRGGIGVLARALLDAVARLGGEVRLPSRVRALVPIEGGYRVETRHGPVRARQVIANLLPGDLRRLLGAETGALPRLDRLDEEVRRGWGAVMLYLVARAPEGASPEPRHLELIGDPSLPFVEGNHLFVSISGEQDEGRAPRRHRTLTMSTHVSLEALRALPDEARGHKIAAIQARMREGLQALLPAWSEGVVFSLPASPRTFERFTGRSEGAVGGIPRRAGLHHYRGLWPKPVLPGLWMVGDSVFPGQSTLATAISGVRVAACAARELGVRDEGARPAGLGAARR